MYDIILNILISITKGLQA